MDTRAISAAATTMSLVTGCTRAEQPSLDALNAAKCAAVVGAIEAIVAEQEGNER